MRPARDAPNVSVVRRGSEALGGGGEALGRSGETLEREEGAGRVAFEFGKAAGMLAAAYATANAFARRECARSRSLMTTIPAYAGMTGW